MVNAALRRCRVICGIGSRQRILQSMSSPSFFPGFDGLLTLSRREGVDIRPTLLRVLTDLYVQSATHTADEERQFVALAARLYDEVDDATRAAVRGRLSIYPSTPAAIAEKFGLTAAPPEDVVAPPLAPQLHSERPHAAALSMQPRDASEISGLFWRASGSERAQILANLASSPLKPALRIPARIGARAIETLEMAAFAEDAENFAREISDSLIIPLSTAQRIVGDEGGEALACALKALEMPAPAFQRVLMFLDPARAQVDRVYRLARMFDRISERAALILLAAWRGASLAQAKPRHQALLHDDERARARSAAPAPRPAREAAPTLHSARGIQK